ncbi:Ig-like domain-containing protein [Pseudomonas putida]|uniref:Ig-like domain-containing protein n=1 Tax=Pseudomonas putida TaxID=303 RepID=UPI0039DFA93B
MPQPNFLSAYGYISETAFTLVFDSTLDAGNPPPINAFDVWINEAPVTVLGITVNSETNSVTLSISSFLMAGDIVEFGYFDPTPGNDQNAIQGQDGSDAFDFSHTIIVTSGRPGPAAPLPPILFTASDSSTLGDGITSDATPTLIGVATANATVTLYDSNGTTVLGTASADGAGNWSITSSTLMDGNHSLKVSQTVGGSTSPLSTALDLTIDTIVVAPNALTLNIDSDSGTVGDGISNHSAPTINGIAEANADVTLYDTDGVTVLGTAKATPSGNWSITSSTLSTGAHTITAKQVDLAGNVSTASNSFTYTLDDVGPTGMALSSSTVSVNNAGNGTTIATLTATDATAISYGFAVGNGVIDADNSKFTLSGNQLVAAQNLAAGTYHLYLQATDAAGNAAYEFFSIEVVDAPSVTAIERASGASSTVPASNTAVAYTVTFNQSVTGVDVSDFALTATGTASGTIAAVSGGGNTYTVTLDQLSGDGTLRLDLNANGTGIQNGSATAINSGYTAGQIFTLDHTAPLPPSKPVMAVISDTGKSSSDSITNSPVPVFVGSAEPNATVLLYDTDGTTVIGAGVADISGDWTILSGPLIPGSHTLTAKQTDAAGNVSAASSALTVVIDTSAAAPTAPVLSSASDSGVLGDNLTNIATPTITGTAESNADITLYDTDGITVLGTTVSDNNGNWSIVSSPLSNGTHTLTVRQIDVAGNVSPASTSLALNVNNVPPPAPSLPVLSAASDSGAKGDGNTTVAKPVITGTADANSIVTLYDTDGTTALGTAVADGTGNWSITSSTLSLGSHMLTAKQIDQAGNVSTASSPLALTISAVPPVPTPPSPPTTTTSIDGVTVTQQQASIPGGGSGAQIIVPIVSTDRIDSIGSVGVADIPLVTNGTSNLLSAQVAPGFGLTALGGSSQPAGTSLESLIQAILAATPDHIADDQQHLTGNGINFLDKLADSTQLLIQTITPVTAIAAPTSPLTLTGTSNENQHTALVIDAAQMANGSTLVLNAVDFAAIIGTANIIGNTDSQILTGDAASQQFSVSSGSNSSVFAGGGSDALHINFESSNAAPSTSSTVLLHGGQGNDTVAFNGASTDYLVEHHEGYLLVASKTHPAQKALILNAESLVFTDTTIGIPTSEAQTELSGLYQSILGRQADYLGFDYWANQSKNGMSMGSIVLSLIASPEAQNGHTDAINGDVQHDLELLYQGIYGRQADDAGLAYWTNAMQQGMTLEQVADNFVHAPEMDQHKIVAANWDFVL